MNTPQGRGNTFRTISSTHMPKMAAKYIYGENVLKNHFLRNQKANDLGPLHVAFGMLVYQVCTNKKPSLTMAYFMVKPNLFPNTKME